VLGRTDSRWRLLFLLLAFVLAGGGILVRLGYWQIAQHDRLVDSARRQIYVRVEVPSRRGQIFDRSGTIVLAASTSRDRLIVSAQHLDRAELAAMTEFLAVQLALDAEAAESLRAKLETSKPYLVVARNLAPERSAEIEAAAREQGIDGITFESDSARTYPQPGGSPGSSLAAHLIGFVNRDGEGQYGVEQYYQEALAGAPKIVEADRGTNGRAQPETERTVDPGVPGADIRLTIDAGLQLALEQEVMAARIADGAASVSAFVMDPWTGEVYAEASYPTYDANAYATVAADDPGRFIDPVVSQVYEPGSVFKLLTVIAGLEQGTTSLTTEYRDSGSLRLDNGKTRIEDADKRAMGVMPLADAIAYSRNVVAAKVALGLGDTTHDASTVLHEVWTRLGFGSSTGIDVAGEVRGLVNDPTISAWREIDLANGSFGQGVAVTQVQLATAYAAMVNGGTLVRPHVVVGLDGRAVDFEGAGGVISPGLSRDLTGLLEDVFQSPWYRAQAQVSGYWVGGKTGTAHIWDAEAKQWSDHYNFSAVGFIGRREGRPDLVVAVRIGRSFPVRNAAGQLVLPITPTELFRRVATDAITTPGLLPALVSDGPVARADR
jgi:cell division protein FtsI/penicillin-binding protein 2